MSDPVAGWYRLRERALLVLLLLYPLGLAIFPPRIVLNSDESQYVLQAVAFSRGEARVEARDPTTWRMTRILPSPYPPGTSLIQAPFVWLGGWRGACWASALALLGLTWLTAGWLRQRGLPAIYAAIIPLFLPASVLARTGMGDVVSAVVVVIAMKTLDTSRTRQGTSIGAYLAGVSTLFRDANPLFLAPWLLGRLWRRREPVLLAVCFATGVATRLVLAWLLQGNPLALHPPYAFTFAGATERAFLYGFVLLVFVPGGLLATALYRGPRRAELTATVIVAWAFFSLYSYAGQHSGFVRSLVLGPRYLIPLVPVLAIAIAEVISRRVASSRFKAALEIGFFTGAVALTCAVHPLLQSWSVREAKLVQALYEATSPEALLVTEPGASAKYVNGLYGSRTIINRLLVPPEDLPRLLERSPVQLVFVDRDESDYWRAMAELNARYLSSVAVRCELKPRVDLTSGERLRVTDVVRCY